MAQGKKSHDKLTRELGKHTKRINGERLRVRSLTC